MSVLGVIGLGSLTEAATVFASSVLLTIGLTLAILETLFVKLSTGFTSSIVPLVLATGITSLTGISALTSGTVLAIILALFSTTGSLTIETLCSLLYLSINSLIVQIVTNP